MNNTRNSPGADGGGSEAVKYQHRDPREGLLPDEPYFFIRARDVLSVHAVAAYASLCTVAGLDQNASEILELCQAMSDWQDANRDRVRLPSCGPYPEPIEDGLS